MTFKSISLDVIDQMRAMAKLGWGRNQIAGELGVSRSTVSKYAPGACQRIRARERLADFTVPEDTRDLTGRFCGDPLPGRSALDKRRSE